MTAGLFFWIAAFDQIIFLAVGFASWMHFEAINTD